MLVFQCSYREPWLLKQRLQERPELRLVQRVMLTKTEDTTEDSAKVSTERHEKLRILLRTELRLVQTVMFNRN